MWPICPVEAGSGVLNLRLLYHSVIDSFRKLRYRFKKPESILDIIIKGQILRLGWYLLGWIIGVFILSILVSFKIVDSTYLTVFLIVVILYALILGARLIDFWDFLEPKPIRFHLLLYAAIGIYALLEDWAGRSSSRPSLAGPYGSFIRSSVDLHGPLRFVLFLISVAIVAGLTLGERHLGMQSGWNQLVNTIGVIISYGLFPAVNLWWSLQPRAADRGPLIILR